MTTTTSTEITITARVRCFRGANREGILADHSFVIQRDGTVRVYDDIAGHYTLHHGMDPRTESRVRNLGLRMLKIRDGE